MSAACWLPARAQTEVPDVLRVEAGYEMQTDSNLFRQSAAANARAERIGIATVGLRLDKTYSLQRLQLDASVSDHRYQNFTYLGFDALRYAATWHWAVTPSLTGRLASRREVSPNSFVDFREFGARNLRTVQATSLDAEAAVGGGWRLVGTLEQLRRSDEVPVVQEGEQERTRVAAGVRHDFATGSAVGYRLAMAHGSYALVPGTASTVTAGDFREHEHAVHAVWASGSKLQLTARLAHVARTHAGVPARDDARWTGEARARYAPSPKSTLDLVVAHEAQAYQSENTRAIASRRVALAAEWQAGAKTSVRLSHERAQRSYEALADAGTVRRDSVRVSALGLQWRPTPRALLRLSLQSIHSASSVPALGFSSRGASIAAQLSF